MEDFKEQVYLTLNGELIPAYCVPGVENAFAEGAYCLNKYKDIMDAYGRLCERLGVMDEDDDVEIIIDSFLDIERYLCLKMYEYGATLEK